MRRAAAAVNGLGDCESIHGADGRNSGSRELKRTCERAAAAAAKGGAAGETAVRKGAKKV